MVSISKRVHLIGCIVALVAALVLLATVFPFVEDLVFPKGSRPFGMRGEAIDYLFVALVPVVLWLVPYLMRGLAHLTHHAHKLVLGRSGFYVRYSVPRPLRFRDTVVRSVGPLAIDLLVIAEIEYFLGAPDVNVFSRGLFSVPFLFLAGILTSLMPGPWLVDALDLRLVNPSKGEVVREAALFEGLLGPIGALALLVSFVTLAHSVGDSYQQGTVLMALWAVRMFPAVLAAVSVYRMYVEPDVLPQLVAWAKGQGIPEVTALPQVLEELRPLPPPPPVQAKPAAPATSVDPGDRSA